MNFGMTAAYWLLGSCHGPFNVVRVDQSPFDELDFAVERRKVLAVTRHQTIEHAHPIAACHERTHNMRTNESRAAGNEVRAHRSKHTSRQAQPLRSREN